MQLVRFGSVIFLHKFVSEVLTKITGKQLNAAEQERQEKTDAILELLHTMEAQLGRMCPAQADAEASMQDDEAK